MVKVYDLTVSKIWCTMCANKIKTAFESVEGVINVQVNVMAERVIITIDESLIEIDQIRDTLKSNEFFIVGEPRVLGADSSQQRVARFFMTDAEDIIQELQDQFKGSIFDIRTDSFEYQSKEGMLLCITYQPLILQGHQIFKFIEERKVSHGDMTPVVVYNEILEKFQKKNKHFEAVPFKRLCLSLIISSLYIVFTTILPNFSFFEDYMIYPQNDTVFTYYLTLVTALTIFTIFYFGTSTYKNAYQMFIKYRMANMDTLITLGSMASFVMSSMLIIVYSFQNAAEGRSQMESMEQTMNIVHDFESAGLILTVITIGKYFEGKAKKTILKMQDSIFPREQLLRTPIVTRITVSNQDYAIENQQCCEVSLLEIGDLILLNGNMKLLLDGVIVKGQVQVVDSICYGQDDAFDATIGMRLKSGADILEGSCIFQVEQCLEGSMLIQIADQLNLAQADRSDQEYGISALLQSVSQRFVLGVVIISLSVLIVWIVLISQQVVHIQQYCVWCFPFERAISVLVASCPCALGLAVPSVIVISLNLALKSGILVKKNTIFEKISKVKAVVFDKTGTLFTKIDHIESFTLLHSQQTEITEHRQETKQKYKEFQSRVFISDDLETQRQEQCKSELYKPYNKSLNLEDIWAIISVLEKDFKHPLANLLFKESVKRQIGKQSTFVNYTAPKLTKTGIIGSVTRTTDKETFQCLIGSPQHIINNGIKISDQYLKLEQDGKTLIMLAIDGIAEIQLCLDNKSNLRPEAKQVIKHLQTKLKKQVYILSGDSKKTVRSVGNYLGIPKANQFGETDALGKQRLLQMLHDRNEEVMMIGDGLNDVLSLQSACVGVSINAKSELNLAASDVIVLNENLWKIVALFQLMNTSIKFVYINLIWAFGYNLFIAPIAAGAFYGVGFTVSPMISSASMSVSSVIVVLISNLMRFINFDPSIKKRSKQRNSQLNVSDTYTSYNQFEHSLDIDSKSSLKSKK